MSTAAERLALEFRKYGIAVVPVLDVTDADVESVLAACESSHSMWERTSKGLRPGTPAYRRAYRANKCVKTFWTFILNKFVAPVGDKAGWSDTVDNTRGMLA